MRTESARRVFQFGVFEADEHTGELRKRGVRIKLAAQPFQALLMLLEKPGDLVSREEMRLRLWGGDTFVDFDHSLNTAVNKIREALGDSASQPRYIETVPGKGYRFIAPITPAANPELAEHTDAPPSETVGLLTTPGELPAASRMLIRVLLLLMETMYLAFYLGALANLQEIKDIFWDAAWFPASPALWLLIITAAAGIPVRLYLFCAVAFDFAELRAKFHRLFPALLPLDVLWALSPFLLVHHVSTGLALGIAAVLVYAPFAHRSLVLMYDRCPERRLQGVP